MQQFGTISSISLYYSIQDFHKKKMGQSITQQTPNSQISPQFKKGQDDVSINKDTFLSYCQVIWDLIRKKDEIVERVVWAFYKGEYFTFSGFKHFYKLIVFQERTFEDYIKFTYDFFQSSDHSEIPFTEIQGLLRLLVSRIDDKNHVLSDQILMKYLWILPQVISKETLQQLIFEDKILLLSFFRWCMNNLDKIVNYQYFLLTTTLIMYEQSQRQELIEFRNYVRQVTTAKINNTQEKSPNIKNSTKQLSFILKSTQLKQNVQEPIKINQNMKTSYEQSYIQRSQSQPFVQFDANCWKENQNSFSKNKNQGYISVSDLIKISNGLNQMSKKEIREMTSTYLHSLHELDLTLSTLLKRID
ncbi:unnamed protein product [Paramecium sonneborni]|uniref:Uncharacterized protein n=1 Tax=Paramecium sonneborni TaxID=65129 RepID=A0A8S1R844_9CILI|nr:unnamed protein product [Paramecium sonneborni]